MIIVLIGLFLVLLQLLLAWAESFRNRNGAPVKRRRRPVKHGGYEPGVSAWAGPVKRQPPVVIDAAQLDAWAADEAAELGVPWTPRLPG